MTTPYTRDFSIVYFYRYLRTTIMACFLVGRRLDVIHSTVDLYYKARYSNRICLLVNAAKKLI